MILIYMLCTCTVLEKSRSDSLKKFLLKIKETINKRGIKKANVKVSGISHKEFTYTVFPIWPLFKELKQSIVDYEFISPPSFLDIEDEPSTTLISF